MEVKVLESQSLFDLSVQACGSVEAVFGVAALNGLSITDELSPGETLEISETLNKPVSDYYTRNSLRPATDSPSSGEGGGGIEGLLDDGIDYMAIEVDNIVM